MNNSIKSGFLILSGTIGIVGIIIAAMISPATSWVTPPGRIDVYKRQVLISEGQPGV